MGISEKNLPFVFDRFWQADGSSKRKYQGVGIGLALVKELTEVQGGKVIGRKPGRQRHHLHRAAAVSESREPAPAPTKAEEAPNADPDACRRGGTVSFRGMAGQFVSPRRTVPGHDPVAGVAAAGRDRAQRQQCPTLLVADDEPDMLRFLKSQLSTHYQVLEAVDGQQAVEKASQFLPDIILLDMMMPEKDGLQACREIRAAHLDAEHSDHPADRARG